MEQSPSSAEPRARKPGSIFGYDVPFGDHFRATMQDWGMEIGERPRYMRLQGGILVREAAARTQMEQLMHTNTDLRLLTASVDSQLRSLSRPDAAPVRLNEWLGRQKTVERNIWRPGARAYLLRILQQRGLLAPIPEIHWRVDRSTADYRRRLGVDVVGLLAERAQTEYQTVFEPGPGCGRFKQDLRSAIDCHHVALADRIYYPLTPVIGALIDFDAVEDDTGIPLPKEERGQMADMLYKLLVIEEGQTDREAFAYDDRVRGALAEDADAILSLLPYKAARLAETPGVPDTVSRHRRKPNGEPEAYYPYSLKAPDTASFRAAAAALAKDAQRYFRMRRDVHRLMPVDIPGTIIGDFDAAERLEDGQVDVIPAVRSTVYKRGDDYIRLMTTLYRKLKGNGLLVADCMRDNDGHRYRLPEWEEIRTRLGDASVGVVIGKAFPGEDRYQGGEGVPLSVVLARSESDMRSVTGHLHDGSRLRPLEDVCADVRYRRALESTGPSIG